MKIFKSFNNNDALKFGLKVIELVEKNKLKPVRIRVVLNNDIVFQYMMDGKKGEEWLDKKQRTVEVSHQSSLYVFNHQDKYPELLNDHYAICGGGYPIFVNNEFKGVFIVSGLKHDEDHQLIKDAIKEME